MRTDSTRVAAEAVAAARDLIAARFGKKYVSTGGPRAAKKAPAAVQDAHEAVRPTDIALSPDEVKDYLGADALKLYTLIWQRFTASQMAPAVLETVTVEVGAGTLLLRASGSTLSFDGFYAVWPREGDKDAKLPELAAGDALAVAGVEAARHWTQGPQRYTEASLIKEMEERGIGRPSTYVPTLVTIQKRKYAALEQRRFAPLWLGETVNNLMKTYFPDIVDVAFTAEMERDLDGVEEGKQEWVGLLGSFYDEFKGTLAEAEARIDRVEKPVEQTDQICPECGSPMVIKMGRYGRFLSCSNYPTCTHAEQLLNRIGVPCPNGCGGDVIERRTKRGRTFYGCSTYPACTFASWDRPLTGPCPECGGLLVALGGRQAGKVKCIACGHIAEAPSEADAPVADLAMPAPAALPVLPGVPVTPEQAREPVGAGV